MYKSNLKNALSVVGRVAKSAAHGGAKAVRIRMQAGLSGPMGSKPGQMPGLRSGSLRRSIMSVAVDGSSGGDAESIVTINKVAGGVGKTPPWLYGMFLEEGTTRMEARPFFKPVAGSKSVQGAALRNAATEARKVIK